MDQNGKLPINSRKKEKKKFRNLNSCSEHSLLTVFYVLDIIIIYNICSAISYLYLWWGHKRSPYFVEHAHTSIHHWINNFVASISNTNMDFSVSVWFTKRCPICIFRLVAVVVYLWCEYFSNAIYWQFSIWDMGHQ